MKNKDRTIYLVMKTENVIDSSTIDGYTTKYVTEVECAFSDYDQAKQFLWNQSHKDNDNIVFHLSTTTLIG